MLTHRTTQGPPRRVDSLGRTLVGGGPGMRLLACLIAMWGMNAGTVRSDEPLETLSDELSALVEEADSLMKEGQMKTLGGRQFWGDVHFFQGWSIQQNVLTGHYRLLDANDERHCWGTYVDCYERLRAIKAEQQLPAMTGKAIVLVHGIIRSSKSLHAMQKPFTEAGYTVFAFDYPSTQITIPESAEYLNRALESLEGIEEINFVVHSMGGLVVRSYLKEHFDPRIKRMVMLGVPNLGAHMADLLKENVLFRGIMGPAGQQLVSDSAGLIAGLPTPNFEFAIVAGGRGTENGYNPLIPGDDDVTVSVESTRLPGATDFIRLPVLHSFMMGDAAVVDCSVRFIKSGELRAEGERQPIEAHPEPALKAVGGLEPVGQAFVPDS